MSIPDYQSLMLPLLRQTSDRREHFFPDLVDALAVEFRLTDAERRELLPSGGKFIFANRVGWARTYMKKAGLLSAPKRGVIQITDRGLQVLRENPKRIDNTVLRKFPEFLEFQSAKTEDAKEAPLATVDERLDPQENIEAAYRRIEEQLADDLLARIKGCTWDFFERLVVDLLLKMGYGGSRLDAGKAFQKSRDGGVDGVIKEDKLGLGEIYIQAKRWDEGQVGSKDIQAFVGALQGKKAHKGVFITTSGFSKPAEEYARSVQDKVILINGPKLADLLIEYGVRVSPVASYEIKKIDSDYFAEE
jgi:restriction system protein